MTKEVLISIQGVQLGSKEEPIRMTALGSYHFTNGTHYIQYEECATEDQERSKNTIKISSEKVELSKKGAAASQMTFHLSHIEQAIYQTPYGSLSLETNTHSIRLQESNDKIEVGLQYSLFSDAKLMSEHELNIVIIPEPNSPE